MPVKAWKVLNTKYLLKRKGVAVRIDQCETGSGHVFEPYVIETGTWVNVIALTKNREVVLIKQYRHGVQEVLLEIPAGIMDDEDDNPLQTAQRELLEETGYTSNKFIEVGKIYSNPESKYSL